MRHFTVDNLFFPLPQLHERMLNAIASAIHPSYVSFVKCTQFTEMNVACLFISFFWLCKLDEKPKRKRHKTLFSMRDCNWSLLQFVVKNIFNSFFCGLCNFLSLFFWCDFNFNLLLAQALFVSHFAKEKIWKILFMISVFCCFPLSSFSCVARIWIFAELAEVRRNETLQNVRGGTESGGFC